MRVINAILDVIANNYIFFVAITIFLLLSLIGFYVDKKTRKDADITPILGKKVSLNLNFLKNKKERKSKKGKSSFSTTIVGGTEDKEAIPNINQPAAKANNQYQSIVQSGYNNIPNNTNLNTYNNEGISNQLPNGTNNYVQTLPDGTQVDPSLFANIPGQNIVTPTVETAQIDNTILPNVAITPTQAPSQGLSSVAPEIESIIPDVNAKNSTTINNNSNIGAVNMNMMADDEQAPINFNINE